MESSTRIYFRRAGCAGRCQSTVAKTSLAQGNTSNVEWFRGIGEDKIDWWPGYRIYLAKDGEALIILFGGSTKKERGLDHWSNPL